jgi:hypothetical protein
MDSSESPWMTREEVAQWFRKPVRWFYDNYGRLVKEHDFPKPRIGDRRGALWFRLDLDKWLKRYTMLTGQRAAKPSGPYRSQLDRQRAVRLGKAKRPPH